MHLAYTHGRNIFTKSTKQNKYEIIKLDRLLVGYQRANWPSMLAAYDKFVNNSNKYFTT